MSLDLSALDNTHKLLFTIPLQPVQGQRFQPTGFPGLGPATYQTTSGVNLLVESAQSMANRLELTIWNEEERKATFDISHVRVMRNGEMLTSSLTEAHRLNSPYILGGKIDDSTFIEVLKSELGPQEGPVDRRKLSKVLFKYDLNTLIHGVFLAKTELAGGRLRIARSLSAFIEAEMVSPVISGGVKNDHVNPSGDTAKGFGNVPFTREEFTAEQIKLYVNLDLAQLRGFGLDEAQTQLLVTLALYKVRRLIESSLRLRTACDLEVITDQVTAQRPAGFALPSLEQLRVSLEQQIETLRDQMEITEVSYQEKL